MFEKQKWNLAQYIWRIIVVIIMCVIIVGLIYDLAVNRDTDWKIILILIIFILCVLYTVLYYWIRDNQKLHNRIKFICCGQRMLKIAKLGNFNFHHHSLCTVIWKKRSVIFMVKPQDYYDFKGYVRGRLGLFAGCDKQIVFINQKITYQQFCYVYQFLEKQKFYETSEANWNHYLLIETFNDLN